MRSITVEIAPARATERPSDRAPRRRRYIGNFADVEITAALDLTTRTVRRDGKKARLLLAEALR